MITEQEGREKRTSLISPKQSVRTTVELSGEALNENKTVAKTTNKLIVGICILKWTTPRSFRSKEPYAPEELMQCFILNNYSQHEPVGQKKLCACRVTEWSALWGDKVWRLRLLHHHVTLTHIRPSEHSWPVVSLRICVPGSSLHGYKNKAFRGWLDSLQTAEGGTRTQDHKWRTLKKEKIYNMWEKKYINEQMLITQHDHRDGKKRRVGERQR